MIPDLRFYSPDNLEEALKILRREGPQCRVLAGGTDIIPGFVQGSKRFKDIAALLDIRRIPELQDLRVEQGSLFLGAGMNFTQIARHPEINRHFPVLTRAVETIGSRQIRNRATIAGNFVNNAPCADSVPALLVYGARLHLRSAGGDRTMLLESFLQKPYQTRLQPDEIVCSIELPVEDACWRGDFYKLGRRRGVAISRLTLALLLETKSGVLNQLRLASGAVTPIGRRFHELEQWMTGQDVTEDNLKELAARFGQAVLDETGLRWSSAYKLPVLQQMLYQRLTALCRESKK